MDPDRRFTPGQKVMALVGGMGRRISGSYAERVKVPSSNVVAVESDLSWEELSAIPESYATPWTSLVGILAVAKDQVVTIRGATSALGQAALNIAGHAGAHVIATTRNSARASMLESLLAREVMVESSDLAERVRQRHPQGIDAVLDIVGNTTILDSLAMLRRGGHACLVGFLGGGPLTLQPVFQMPSGANLTVFASALVTGTPEFPLSEIPFQTIVDRVAEGGYRAKPAKVFALRKFEKPTGSCRRTKPGASWWLSSDRALAERSRTQVRGLQIASAHAASSCRTQTDGAADTRSGRAGGNGPAAPSVRVFNSPGRSMFRTFDAA
jgi:NADPH:quinone reductase